MRSARIEGTRQALDAAERAIAEDKSRWRRLAAWWTGSAITGGWGSVHRAEANLVFLETGENVRARLPSLLAWIQEVMEIGRRRRRYETELTEFIERPNLDTTVVAQAYEDVITANSKRHANLRAFRNGLAVVNSVFALVLVGLAVWHAIDPHFISLCGAESAKVTCLSDSEPGRADLAMVALVGALGGLLAGAFGLGSLETAPSRYDPRVLQAALKPIAGAATGLIGVLLIQSDIFIAPASGSSEGSSESLLLAYAAIFGFSQQLLTRFVDKRAEELLGEEEASTAANA